MRRMRASARVSGSSLMRSPSFSFPWLLIGVDSLLAYSLLLLEGCRTTSDGMGVSDFMEIAGVVAVESDCFCFRVDMID